MVVEEEIGTWLAQQGLTLATAESCTGGLVAHRLTNVPGSSAYYLGGFVAYANQAKEALLGVRHETLLAHGAVSEATAREMARGACQRMGADVGVSVTGIAGPTGGTSEKPVGLVYVALSARDSERCQRHVWQGDRRANKEQSAEAALGLVLAYLQERGKAMVQLVNETVNVEVRLRKDETALPLAFMWCGRRYEIESWGRESVKEGECHAVRCYMVQTAGPETWELCHDIEAAQWTLTRHWARNYQIV